MIGMRMPPVIQLSMIGMRMPPVIQLSMIGMRISYPVIRFVTGNKDMRIFKIFEKGT